MRVLVTGASGFVGKHLLRNLIDHRHEVIPSAPHEFTFEYRGRAYPSIVADLCKTSDCQNLIERSRSDAVIHLAGMSHVQQATEQRLEMAAGNIMATLELMKAVYAKRSPCTVAIASTAQMYRASQEKIETVVQEDSEIELTLPYAVSKLAAEHIARSFADELLRVYMVRPFNHIGPGQASTFVCPGFAERIKSAKSGDTIPVGNLNAKRDFTDVRDVVDLYRLVIEKKPEESVFVVGSGRTASIQEVLDYLIKISGKNIKTEVDPLLIRTIDPPCFRADSSLAKRVLGWTPKYNLEQSLDEIFKSI